jgi:predicted RNA-binding Zn-ribbon protein involved in translation (DUF1610 family)
MNEPAVRKEWQFFRGKCAKCGVNLECDLSFLSGARSATGICPNCGNVIKAPRRKAEKPVQETGEL